MRLVVDASTVIGVVLAEGGPGPLGEHELLAPPIMPSEVVSVVSEMAWRREIPRSSGREAIGRLEGLGITIDRPESLFRRAWDVAGSLGWARTYDAEYVALAAIRELPLVTIDGRLRRGAGRLVRVLTPDDVSAIGTARPSSSSRAVADVRRDADTARHDVRGPGALDEP